MNRRRVLTITVGAMILGGALMAGSGSGVTPAAAQAVVAPAPPNPLTVIIDKLNQILAALTGAAGQSNHTLRWDTNHASATRFTTAFTGAVLDNNTGLVWEQAPDATTRKWQDFNTPLGATNYCVNKTVGGTVGWRLPSVAELKSVQDPSLPAPFVPAIFTGVQSVYWSASTLGTNPSSAWLVVFNNGGVNGSVKTHAGHAWCVRGGMNADTY